MATITETSTKLKNKEKDLKKALNGDDLDTVLKNVKKLDNTCAFAKCKNRTNDYAIECKYCVQRFCPTHGLPEIHGCGEAVRKDERSKFLHPNTKLSQDGHSKASTKLTMKLKEMQQERKAKLGGSKKKK